MMQREVKDTPLLEGKLSDLVTDMLYDPEQVTSSLDLNVLISKMGQRSVLPETRHEGLMQEGAGASRGGGGLCPETALCQPEAAQQVLAALLTNQRGVLARLCRS